MPEPSPIDFTDPNYLAAREAALRGSAAPADDAPWRPPSFAEALRVSEKITSDYRELHRPDSIDVKPSEVAEILNGLNLKHWVLMALHGYVGYMSDPRATQDVHVLIPRSQKGRVTKAILERWPNLVVSELEFVIRFKDPGDTTSDGQPKPVIDVMLPWADLHATILEKHVVVDSKTRMRLPSLEAAIACKYATLISPHRLRQKKLLDEADFNSLVAQSNENIDRGSLIVLANLIWENGGQEIIEFINLSLADQPLPI